MIRRHFSKRDTNHTAIVRALRAAGRYVLELHALGGSAPDILVCWPGGIVLMEIKAAKGKLTPGQETYHQTWRGPPGSLVIVHTERQALALTGVKC